ncbi:hypothetical protein BDA96_03G005000 [Sorghum bicolor]|uniref:Uncharacterized protein n=1 Tax=Sorghum bicolor TaxID=4558 RepID=A0A921UNC8_SORBI|nr:hypothetical protein BDA96_03G005000 [Sorghum bicolor]
MAAAAASVWLQLQVPPHRLHSPPVLSLPSNHSSSHACPPVYKYKKHAAPGRGNLLLCRASGASSSSVVTKEQEGAASDPSSEEGYSEPQIYSYKDDPNFRRSLLLAQLNHGMKRWFASYQESAIYIYSAAFMLLLDSRYII